MAQSNPGSTRGSQDESRNRKVEKKTLDLTLRNVLEFVVSVYVTGCLPMFMHLFVTLFEAPSDWFWVRAEAWLIVVVICGAALADAWRERRVSDDALNSVAAIFGALGTFFGALAYAILTIRPKGATYVAAVLDGAVWWVVVFIAVLYLAYRLPTLRRSAGEEAEKLVARSKGASKKKVI